MVEAKQMLCSGLMKHELAMKESANEVFHGSLDIYYDTHGFDSYFVMSLSTK